MINAEQQLMKECTECLKITPQGSRSKDARRKLINIFIENAPIAYPELSQDDLKNIKWSLIQSFCL